MIICTIAGRIGKDAVLRSAGDTQVAGFPVAADVGYGDNKQTLWFDCSKFGKVEKLAGYLTKGSAVTVTGELSTREHEGKTYLKLRVTDLTLQGGGSATPSALASADDFQGSSVPF